MTASKPVPSLQTPLTGAHILNARLPEEIWNAILDQVTHPYVFLALRHRFYLKGKSAKDTLTALKGTCRALHRWVQIKEWQHVSITSVRALKNLLRRVELEPGVLDLVRVFRVAPNWAWTSKYAHDWRVGMSPDEWYFDTRSDYFMDYFEEHMVPYYVRFDPDDDDAQEYLENYGWEDKDITGWNDGPDGCGEIPGLKDAAAFRRKLEQILLQMHSLRVFHYGTQIIPMTEMMCRFLGQLRDLEVVSIAPSGEFFTSNFSLSPLWLLFEGRGERPLHCLYLNVEVLPSAHQLTAAEGWMDEKPTPYKESLCDSYEDRTPIYLGDTSRYMEFARWDDKVEEQLSFVERPLAMVYRTLMASRGKLRQLRTTETALARVGELLPVWTQVAFFAYDNPQRRTRWESDVYVNAVLVLHQGLRRLTRRRHNDDTIPTEKDLLVDMTASTELSPLDALLRGRRATQEDLWRNFVDGQAAGLSSWDLSHMQQHPGFQSWLAMSNQPYVVGWFDRWPDHQDWLHFLISLHHYVEDKRADQAE